MNKKVLLVCSYVDRDNDYHYLIDPGKLDLANLKEGDIVTITSKTKGVSLAKVEHILDLEKQGQDFVLTFSKDDFYSCYRDGYKTRNYSAFSLKIKTSNGVDYTSVRLTHPMNKGVCFVSHDKNSDLIVLNDELTELKNQKADLQVKVDDAIRIDDPKLKELRDEYRELLLKIDEKKEEVEKLKKEMEEDKPVEVSEYEEFFDKLRQAKYSN